MSFQKTFDELLNNILNDYRSQIPDADTSKGSLLFIKSACMASALWGLYKHQEWISRQIFPDTADTEYLEKWAWLYAVDRLPDDSDADLVKKILDRIQSPPAGGNKADYIRWANEIVNVKYAYCYPLAMGLGTVVMVIVADEVTTGNELPASHADITGSNDAIAANKLVHSTQTFITKGISAGALVINDTTGTTTRVTAVESETELSLDTDIFKAADQTYTVRSMLEEVRLYIESVQPVIAGDALSVIGPLINIQDVDMTITGANADKDQTALDIAAYMKGLAPGEALYRVQLTSIAINNGAENVNITSPDIDVISSNYEMVRPGTIDVT